MKLSINTNDTIHTFLFGGSLNTVSYVAISVQIVSHQYMYLSPYQQSPPIKLPNILLLLSRSPNVILVEMTCKCNLLKLPL